MRGYWINTTTNEASVVETNGRLKDLYRMCECDLIDIAVMEVCGHELDFVVDDEGLLKDAPKASVFDSQGRAMLVGNVVVLSSDDDGDFAGLTDDEIDALRSRTCMALVGRGDSVRNAIVVITD